MIIDHPSAFRRSADPVEPDLARASEPAPLATTYEGLREQGLAAVERGEFESALQCFTAALSEAELRGDDDLVDLAVCNRAAVRIELGCGEGELDPLRSIVTRSRRAETRWLAAYSTGRLYELDGQFKKALFYARIAKNLTRDVVDRIEWRASSFNQVGNLLLAESHVEDAEQEYRTALQLIPTVPGRGGVARAHSRQPRLLLHPPGSAGRGSFTPEIQRQHACRGRRSPL